MPSRNLVLALIVDPADLDIDAYLSRFSKPHITFRIFESVRAFRDDYQHGSRFHGIVVETRTVLKAKVDERNFVVDLENKLPVGKFSAPRSPTDKVHELLLRKQWATFLQKAEEFDPRGLRAHARQNCVLQAEMSLDGKERKGQKSVTIDLSNGGCFLMMAEPAPIGTEVNLWFGNSSHPFKGKVTWSREPNANLWEYPGVGIEFAELSVTQKAVIEKVIQLARYGKPTKKAA